MDDILKELDSAFRMLSSISVSGDAVDVMAAVRAKLRRVYAEIDKKAKEKPNE